VAQAPLVEPSIFAEILERLAPVAHDVVLIGGQAVSFWTTRYMDRVPELQRDAPYWTKDLDFCGTAAQARECARLIGGHCREYTVADRSPCTAIIQLGELQIDFLKVPYGVRDAEQVHAHSVPYQYGRVMHPMHMLQSRTANVAELPSHQTERHRKQLRAAVLCVREVLLDTLAQSASEPSAIRSALRMSESIFDLAAAPAGVCAYVEQGLDVLDAVVLDPRLPKAFREVRYPQAKAQVDAKRLQLQRSIEEVAAQPAPDQSVTQAPGQRPERKSRGRTR
jgi:hypothetical protein